MIMEVIKMRAKLSKIKKHRTNFILFLYMPYCYIHDLLVLITISKTIYLFIYIYVKEIRTHIIYHPLHD